MTHLQAVDFDGVSRRFGTTLALDDARFGVGIGETIALLGPNGTGKVLALSATNGTVADIAGRLGLSEGTVRNHLSAAIQKTGARNRAEAARFASDKGWLAPDTDA